jgi:hypothetical protein
MERYGLFQKSLEVREQLHTEDPLCSRRPELKCKFETVRTILPGHQRETGICQANWGWGQTCRKIVQIRCQEMRIDWMTKVRSILSKFHWHIQRMDWPAFDSWFVSWSSDVLSHVQIVQYRTSVDGHQTLSKHASEMRIHRMSNGWSILSIKLEKES